MNPLFHRFQLVAGEGALKEMSSIRVLIVGVGGVGSWCAEGLVRSGLCDLTIVDSDDVCVTNINRQLQATTKTVGRPKVEVLKERLLEINPRANITALEMVYDQSTADQFSLKDYDFVVDAIDSVTPKIDLIKNTLASGTTLFSSMGAACKLDPTRIKVADISKSYGCPLAKIIRTRLKKERVTGKFKVVFSDERLPVQPGSVGCGTATCLCPVKKDESGEVIDGHEWCSTKKVINGSVVHITAIYGFYITSLIISEIMKKFPHIKAYN